MKKLAILLAGLVMACGAGAQSKIFKEVNEDISSTVKPILQDNALVGYLTFTRLEKASVDSFNYRLSIMDENLNDIGKVEFRQALLDLQTVSFEKNVLCLGYIQSSIPGVQKVTGINGLKKLTEKANNSHILLQFVNLSGQILNTWYKDVSLSLAGLPNSNPYAIWRMMGYLKYGMQVKNIPNLGFAVFYGDDLQQNLLEFDLKGNQGPLQEVPVRGDAFHLHTSATDIYLVVRQNGESPEGGYRLFDYSSRGLRAENEFDLRDGYDNWLRILTIDNDPVTGDPFIAGCIINPRRRTAGTANDYANAPYIGLFTLELGNAHKEMHANCSYWNDDKIPGISSNGMFADKDFYVRYATAFRDFDGNTVFAGTALVGKGTSGAGKYKLADAVFVRQEASGNVALDNNIPCDETKYFPSVLSVYGQEKKDYYKVVSPITKSNYMIIDDESNIYIYNVTAKKVVRTIAHKDGNVRINIFPAKEGHMMVAEYNHREKTTRISIEAL
jgi:hypothetical protein